MHTQAIDLTTAFTSGISQQDVYEMLLNNDNVITVHYPMSSIGSANSYLDIIHDYIQASFIVEEIAQCAETVTCEQLNQSYSKFCRITVTARDTARIAQRIYELSVALSGEQEDEDALMSHIEDLNDYEGSLDNRRFACPELIDDYYANLVNGAYYEMDGEFGDDFLENEYRTYPERRFHFWRSAYSNTLSSPFYVSSDCWIVPDNLDVHFLVSKYSSLEPDDELEAARFFSISGLSYLSNTHTIVHFPFGSLINARRCAAVIANQLDSSVEMPETIISTYSPQLQRLMERYDIDVPTHSSSEYLLSTSGSYIIVVHPKFRFVFFPEQIELNKAAELQEQITTVLAHVRTFTGADTDLTLPWASLNDEQFEELCYDILYHHPKFNRHSIRKMGKSRSRDGGRDIVVDTHDRPGHPAKKYIFQCKLAKPGTSLAASKVGNISDTIVQYGAQGYGIFTPVVIDSTLYDRVDAICKRFSIESQHWSGLEIERFVARYPELRRRHFGVID